MQPGTIVGDRFEIQALAGAGGMGRVYRAIERATGAIVAIKLLRDSQGDNAARFVHEARVLASIEHPHVVRYVTHGFLRTGEPYLVMEWVEGERLDRRIAREGLRVDESIDLARRVASALAAAHARGVVHRDIKPINLVLEGGEVSRVKLLDFGIARRPGATTLGLTRTGSLLGTPGYMAPEQARGERESIDARADVFSLGCVLFECLTGRPAFQGAHAMALLAKLLVEEVPRVQELRPEVPLALDELVARMLAKDPARRPADGAAVLAWLSSLEGDEGPPSPAGDEGAQSITGSERRLVSVVAVWPAGAPGVTLGESAPTPQARPEVHGAIRGAAEPFGARVEQLADGTVIAVLTSKGNAADLAVRGARVALAVREIVPEARIALVTGRGDAGGRLPVGEVLERAASILERADAPGRAIYLDEGTRALVELRFDITGDPERPELAGERAIGEEPRTLLGRPSPFVGREREMRYVLDVVDEAFTEPRALALLVTGPAGVGKSRLRQEVVRALRERHPDIAMVLGRGDAIGGGSAFGMVAEALRTTLRMAAGEPPAVQRERLARLVARNVEPAQEAVVTEALAELVGLPLAGDEGARSAAARGGPAEKAERIGAAFIELVHGSARLRPMLLLFEDLQWGDAPSVKILDAALRELARMPLAVLAFARPEVREVFPRLWADRGLESLHLRELPRRAAEALVERALGDSIEPSRRTALVERAGGNAFYLEELVRAVAEGRGDELPDSVIGMVEARLDALDPPARRALRAASIFGQTFWKNGVVALLGGASAGVPEGDFIEELISRELVVRRAERRLAGEEELSFRHALLREGAYATLTERDRALGHKLAAEWLMEAGEQDPAVLAEHLARSSVPSRAAGFFARAAEQALASGDMASALARAERAEACGAEGDALARLLAVQAEALLATTDYPKGLAKAERALELAEPGSEVHCTALATAIWSATAFGSLDAIARLLPVLFSTTPASGAATAAVARAYSMVVGSSVHAGLRAGAEAAAARMEEALGPVLESDPAAAAWVELTRGGFARHVEHDPHAALGHHRAAEERFAAAGDLLYRAFARVQVGVDLYLLGALDEALVVYEQAIASTSPTSTWGLLASLCKALVHLCDGREEEAAALAGAVRARMVQPDAHVALLGAVVAAAARIALGDFAGAARELGALPAGDTLPLPVGALRLSLTAQIELGLGRAQAAVMLAAEAVAMQRAAGTTVALPLDDPETAMLVHAEALLATGDAEGARAVLREARDSLTGRAARIPDAATARSFLERIPSRARLMALAGELLGGEDPEALP
ncbi:serine/threonine-protein kinase [Polyangium aurulentum]|uniref:serine/threonine-protein kinase n=1 Tax=Polyangium aurulentum TaxID=2567896 RepID=UPI0010AEEB59|nr:serine/threonine-protein kinase [Polyangium aurulentum]UQA58184.1 protein kinase [Polyangium aurulentum]